MEITKYWPVWKETKSGRLFCGSCIDLRRSIKGWKSWLEDKQPSVKCACCGEEFRPRE